MSELFWLSILPAAILMFLVYRQDTIEKEPIGLLFRLFVFGMIACGAAILLETIGESLIGNMVFYNVYQYDFVMYFCVVAVSEELVKYVALLTTRKNPNFNYTFDGVVYGVAVGLGFATLENLMYVFSSMSFELAIMRGLMAVPMHCTCGIFMGYYFGQAHRYGTCGNGRLELTYSVLAYVIPVMIHGFYDFSVSTDNGFVTAMGFAFTAAIFVAAVIKVIRASKTDEPIQDVAHGGIVGEYQPDMSQPDQLHQMSQMGQMPQPGQHEQPQNLDEYIRRL